MSTDPSDRLEHRLETLLRSSDLDLPARPEARGVVEGAVRRGRRRRRAVQATVPAVLTVVAVVAGFTVLPDREEGRPAPVAPNILTASGIGELSLGTTVGEAQSAGLVGKEVVSESDKAVVTACRRYLGTGAVNYVSARNGVIVRIDVDAFADTSEGVHTGTTYADVLTTYKKVTKPNGYPPQVKVDVGETGATRYEFYLDAFAPEEVTPATKVASMTLRRVGEGC